MQTTRRAPVSTFPTNGKARPESLGTAGRSRQGVSLFLYWKWYRTSSNSWTINLFWTIVCVNNGFQNLSGQAMLRAKRLSRTCRAIRLCIKYVYGSTHTHIFMAYGQVCCMSQKSWVNLPNLIFFHFDRKWAFRLFWIVQDPAIYCSTKRTWYFKPYGKLALLMLGLVW